MNWLEQVIEAGEDPRPRRILLYGTHGIGKSTWASCAPNPIFIRTEDGIRDIKGAKAFPLCQTFSDLMGQLESLLRGQHDFASICLDSADWAERLANRHVCDEAACESIDKVGGGFGRGQERAAGLFSEMLKLLSELNEQRSMMVILIAHAKIERFESPNTEAYDRYTPKLDKRVNGVIQEWADEVLFANYKTFTRKDGKGFEERVIATGQGERVLFTTERPAHLAKNRLGLPDELPLVYGEFHKFLATNS